MALPPIAALEIGTTKVRVLVGEAREDGHLMITGLGECPSRGLRKGEISHFENAVACVRSALHLAEENARVDLNEVFLLVTGSHIQSLVSRGNVPVMGQGAEITREDMDHAMGTARAVNLPPDREIVHTICQRFYVDDQHGVSDPEGMEGSKLSVDMLIVHGVRSRLRNLVKVVVSGDCEVQDVAFSGLCSALAVLSPEEKEGGVLVLDLGGGTTDFVVYAGNAIACAGSLGVGGDHVTNDIAKGLRIPISQAEQLKEQSGSASVDLSARGQKVTVLSESGVPQRDVRLEDLHTVIHLRVEETLSLVKAHLVKSNLYHQLGCGVVLTGGGAYLRNLLPLAERVFNLPCFTGQPRDVSGLAVATEGPQYAAPVGMLRYGMKAAQRAPAAGGLRRLLGGLFGTRP